MNPGTYNAEVTRLSLTEATSGAVMVNMGFLVPETGEAINGSQCLIQKDGTVSTITCDLLKAIFGWGGVDVFELENPEMHAGKPCQIVCDDETYNGKTSLRVKYVNPPGGGVGAGKPLDRNAFINKHAAKLRALNGGTAAAAPRRPATAATPAPAPATPPPPPAPAPRSAPPSPPRNKVAPSSMDEVWGIVCKAMAGHPDDAVAAEFYRLVEKVAPGKSNDQLTPEDWGRAKIEADNLPF